MPLNKVMLIGRLGKDPELKHTKTGKAVCSFSIATSESYVTDGDRQTKTTWHNIIAWGKLAETVGSYLKKGQEVYVEGRIENRSYEKDGTTKYISEIIMSSLVFLGSKTEDKQDQKEDDDLPF